MYCSPINIQLRIFSNDYQANLKLNVERMKNSLKLLFFNVSVMFLSSIHWFLILFLKELSSLHRNTLLGSCLLDANFMANREPESNGVSACANHLFTISLIFLTMLPWKAYFLNTRTIQIKMRWDNISKLSLRSSRSLSWTNKKSKKVRT